MEPTSKLLYPPIVLFVDDERNILSSIDRLMRDVPVRTEFFDTPSKALEFLHDHHVAVVVSDFKMPEMQGPEFLERAGKIRPDAAMLLLTGESGSGGLADAINRGAISRYIEKPWTNEALTAAIEHYATSVIAERFQSSLPGLMERLAGADSIKTILETARAHLLEYTGIELMPGVDFELPSSALRFPADDETILETKEGLKVPEAYRFFFAAPRPRERLNKSLAVFLRFVAMTVKTSELNERLRDLAVTDGLSGVRNRRAFDVALKEECDRAARYGSALALILCDIDKFKGINDDFGHASGDDVIRGVGEILAKTTRNMDIPCRYGGDEFAVIMPGLDGKGAMGAAERIRKAAMELEARLGKKFPVRMSIGASVWRSEMTVPADILSAVDGALYKAKEAGRDRAILAE